MRSRIKKEEENCEKYVCFFFFFLFYALYREKVYYLHSQNIDSFVLGSITVIDIFNYLGMVRSACLSIMVKIQV